MGAFFLYRKSENIEVNAVKNVFKEMGFDEPKDFDLIDFRLLLYKKQLVEEVNYFADGESSVYCVGTFIYRGLSYQNSLKEILFDFRNNRVNHEKMIGHFCLIFFTNKRIHILLDELVGQHIFVDANFSRVSSSFLALLVSSSTKHQINKEAFYEKVSTGYIVGPDTLVNDIYRITPQLIDIVDSTDIHFTKVSTEKFSRKFHDQGVDQSVAKQVSNLTHYFEEIGSFCREYPPMLGLSGGYDSRLILALTKRLPVKLSVYTHATSGVHEKEREIAELITAHEGYPLIIAPTTPAHKLEGKELETLLKKGMIFFDGRSGHEMSGLSQTYTRSYRLKIMNNLQFEISGNGGEIFRNYSRSGLDRVNWFEWMKAHAYFLNIRNNFDDKSLLPEINSYITKKISDRLGINFFDPVDRFALRRYFSEIYMIDSKNIFSNTQNRLNYFLSPFMEKKILLDAYKALPYIGASGSYESKMIERLDTNLASIKSSYGYPLNSEPFSTKLSFFLQGKLPDFINNFRYSLYRKYLNYGQDNYLRFQTMIANCNYMNNINHLLRKKFPEIIWDELIRDSYGISMITNLGTFLLEFDEYIDY